MYKRKNLLCLIILLTIILFCSSNECKLASAKSNDFLIENNVLIKYNGSAEKVVIPNGVVSIDSEAFYGNSKIKSIIIPNGVKTIKSNDNGYGSFTDCTSLSSITLPDTLETIESYVFKGCKSIKTIKLPEAVEYIGKGTFSGCISMSTINLPNSLEYIGSEVFNNCKSLKSITIPDKVSQICEGAFSGCIALAQVNLSNNVTEIEDEAFSGCSLLKEIVFPVELSKIGKKVFSKCISLNKIDITKKINYIGIGAFSYCTGIEYFNVDAENIYFKAIEGGLYSINQSVLYAYPASSSKRELQVTEEVRIISDYAFSGAVNLTSIKLSDSITGIYPYTFADCKKLIDINVPSTVKVIGEGAFANCISIKQINIPDGVLQISFATFSDCTSLTSITIPSTVKVVTQGALEGCKNIKSIILKEGVEIFYGSNVSSNLEKITLPKSLIKLDGNQFMITKWYKKSKAGSVYLDKHLIAYKEDKTHIASKITSFTVKDGTLSINDEVFNDMVKLIKLTVPKSVIYYNCDEYSNLEKTYWYLNQPNGVLYLGSVAFRLKNNYGGYYLWDGTKEGREISNKKNELAKKYKLVTFDTITLKKGTVSVSNNFGDGAYTDEFSLKYIFPSSLKLIGAKAFENNYYSIQKVTWNTNLKYIEYGAFATSAVKENKLNKNYPSNTVIIEDRSLYAEFNDIDNGINQIKWMTDKLISQYFDYDEENKILEIKSYIPYIEKIENVYYTGGIGWSLVPNIFFEDVKIPEDMECIADYLFGYGKWTNPNLKFEEDALYRKNISTGKWEIVTLGYYTNNPTFYEGATDVKVTWDQQIGFWKVDFIGGN